MYPSRPVPQAFDVFSSNNNFTHFLSPANLPPASNTFANANTEKNFYQSLVQKLNMNISVYERQAVLEKLTQLNNQWIKKIEAPKQKVSSPIDEIFMQDLEDLEDDPEPKSTLDEKLDKFHRLYQKILQKRTKTTRKSHRSQT